MTSTCPDCGQPLAQVQERCPHCGLLLVGPAAAELWGVDQQLAQLTIRRRELLGWLREGSPATRPGPASPDLLPTDTSKPRSVQRLLLGLGVLLLVVAGLVFVAVSWRTLGVNGQVAVVAGAALAGCAASRLLERRGLLASAEAVAVLGTGLVVVGLVAARTLHLGVAERLDGGTYAALSAGLVAVVTAAFGLRSTTYAWSVLAVAAATAAVPLTLDAAGGGQLAASVSLAVAAGAFWVLHLVPPAWLRIRGASRVAALVCAGVGWLLAPIAASTEDRPLALWCAGVGLLVAAAVVLGCSRHGGAAGLWQTHPRLGLTAVLAAAVQIASGTSSLPPSAEAALVVVASIALAGCSWRPGDLRRTWAGVLGLAAFATAGLTSLDLLVELDQASAPGWGDLEPFVRNGTWVAALVAMAAGVAAGLVVAVRRPTWRPVARGTAALCLLVGTAVGSTTATPAAPVVALAVLGVVLAVWASRSTGSVEGVVGSVALLAEAVALVVAVGTSADDLTPAAAVVSATGLVALAYGFRPGRGWLRWIGAVGVPAGVWLVLLDSEVGTIEAFSLPFAATCLLAGVLGRFRRRDLSSWAVVGPALVVALLPSALVSVGDESAVRPLVVLAVGVVLVLVGVWRRWQALVVVPGVAVVLVAISQLAPWAYGLPRWLSLGVAGALLLVVGVRYEARRRNLVAAAHWLRALR